MLLNRFPLNSGVIGSGAPINFVRAAAAQIVTVIGSAASAVTYSAKAAVDCVVSGTAHSAKIAYGKASTVASVVVALTFHAYHPVASTAMAVVRAVCNLIPRFATRGSAYGVASVASSATARVLYGGRASQKVEVICRGHVPWEYAPDERTFKLTTGDRTFVLPKD